MYRGHDDGDVKFPWYVWLLIVWLFVIASYAFSMEIL